MLGLASPTYAGAMPEANPLHWLLDRCVEYELGAMEASLPLEGGEDPGELGRRAADAGIQWIGYWSADFVTPEGAGADSRRGGTAFDVAVGGGVKTVVALGAGGRHNRFTREPALNEQLRRIAGHLGPVAEAAGARGLQLGLLPHLDYRAGEVVQVMEQVGHPAQLHRRPLLLVFPLGKGMALEVFAPGVKVGVDDHRSSILRARRSCEMPVNP